MGRRWRAWSPWRLREALRWQRDGLSDDRKYGMSPTHVEQSYRHAVAALAGHPDPWSEARRYSVDGSTLIIDATKDGSMWPQVHRRKPRPACDDFTPHPDDLHCVVCGWDAAAHFGSSEAP